MKLNKGQEAAKKDLLEFLSNDEQFFVMSAGAGYGKTFTLRSLEGDLDFFNKERRLNGLPEYKEVLYTATTNKASSLFGEATTIDKLLGLVPRTNYQTGEKYTVTTRRTKEIVNAVIVVDECLTPDMEILTEDGFKGISTLDRSLKVAQYSGDETISFVEPIRYIDKHYSGNIIDVDTKRLSFSVTENHDNAYRNKQGALTKVAAKDAVSAGYNKMVTYGKGVGISKRLTQLEKLAIAYQADGSILHPYQDVTDRTNNMCHTRFGIGLKDAHGSSQFSFIKQRKVDQFVSDFNDLGVRQQVDSTRGHRIFTVSNIPCDAVSKNLSDVFSLEDFSVGKAKEFIEYLVLWDGFKVGKSGVGYSNTCKASVDLVQAVATLAGYTSNLMTIPDERSDNFSTCYKLHMYYQAELDTQSLSKKVSKYYEGKVYCVTVPSGYIVVRRNGKVHVTGNCSMLNKQKHGFIEQYTQQSKVIYLLDPYQLPPVGYHSSLVHGLGYQEAILTEPMRQDPNSHLFKICDQLRTDVVNQKYTPLVEGEGITFLGQKEFLSKMVNAFKEGEDARVIAYTNEHVEALNHYVRKQLHGSLELTEGDLMVAASTPRNSEIKKERAYILEQVSPPREVAGIQCYDIALGGETHPVPVDKKAYFSKLRSLKREAKENGDWVMFYEFSELILDLRDGFACTAHASQGSTYDTVFIDFSNLTQATDVNLFLRMLYVSVSRAKKQVYIFGI